MDVECSILDSRRLTLSIGACICLCRGVNFRALEELFRLRDERSNETTYTLQVSISTYPPATHKWYLCDQSLGWSTRASSFTTIPPAISFSRPHSLFSFVIADS